MIMDSRFYKTEVNSAEALEVFGAKLGRLLRVGDFIALSGDLGAGKTTMTRGLIQSQLGDIEVPSPTYTLVQTYDLKTYELWHCDLYRLDEPNDVLELGLIDMRDEIVAIIEWPDRMGGYRDSDMLSIEISFVPNSTNRLISLSGSELWKTRILEVFNV